MKYVCAAVLSVSLTANAYTLDSDHFSFTTGLDDARITKAELFEYLYNDWFRIEINLPENQLLSMSFDMSFTPNEHSSSYMYWVSVNSPIPDGYTVLSNASFTGNASFQAEGRPLENFSWAHANSLVGWTIPFDLRQAGQTHLNLSFNDLLYSGATAQGANQAPCAELSCMTPFKGQGSIVLLINIPHAVPEAGAFSMLIGGLATLGALVRRKKPSLAWHSVPGRLGISPAQHVATSRLPGAGKNRVCRTSRAPRKNPSGHRGRQALSGAPRMVLPGGAAPLMGENSGS